MMCETGHVGLDLKCSPETSVKIVEDSTGGRGEMIFEVENVIMLYA